MKDVKIIGLSGKFGTGKDYIASTYFYPRGFRQMSLAWHFKVGLVGKGKATHEEVFETKPPHVRHMLQQEGTELGRNVYGEDIWVDTLVEWVRVLNETWGQTHFIIPDVRFPNEVEGIQRRGGKVIRVTAPERNLNAPYGEEARSHISETALDTYNMFDYVLFNDIKDVATVPSQISLIFEDMGV